MTWNGKPYPAHRMVFAIAEGLHIDDLKGASIHHLCGHSACCNRRHLQYKPSPTAFREGASDFAPYEINSPSAGSADTALGATQLRALLSGFQATLEALKPPG